MKAKNKFLTVLAVVFAMFSTMFVGTLFSPTTSNDIAYATPLVVHNDYLTFSSDEPFSVSMTGNAINSYSLVYSTDKTTWNTFDSEQDAVLDGGKYKIYICSETTNDAIGKSFEFNGDATGSDKSGISCDGNVMSLLNSENVEDATMTDYAFSQLFKYCDSLVKAPDLPATTLADFCYYRMFSHCWRLTQSPELPAESVKQYSYQFMFEDCISLVDVGKVKATSVEEGSFESMFVSCISIKEIDWDLEPLTLYEDSYYNMFCGCTSLVKAPEIKATKMTNEGCCQGMFMDCESLVSVQETLPATELSCHCYNHMFDGCSSLVNAPILPATTVYNYSYAHMFQGCHSLIEAPALPATTLGDNCYDNMFFECENLTIAPEVLPALVAKPNCYSSMFECCSSLVNAPEIKATTLAAHCFSYMFDNCYSLTVVQETLPATTLGDYCYSGMFTSCYSLTKAPNLPATTPQIFCYNGMFQYCYSLKELPTIGLTTTTYSCCQSMFAHCPLIKLSTTPDESKATFRINSTNSINSWNWNMFDDITINTNTTYYYSKDTAHKITLDSDYYAGFELPSYANAGDKVEFDICVSFITDVIDGETFYSRFISSVIVYKTGDKNTTCDLLFDDQTDATYYFIQPDYDVTVEIKTVDTSKYTLSKLVAEEDITILSKFVLGDELMTLIDPILNDYNSSVIDGFIYYTFSDSDTGYRNAHFVTELYDSNKSYYIGNGSGGFTEIPLETLKNDMENDYFIFAKKEAPASMIIISEIVETGVYNAYYYNSDGFSGNPYTYLENQTLAQLQATCTNIYFFGLTPYSITDGTTDTNGSISIDKAEATTNQEVTITVTPNNGYELNTLIVYKADDTTTTVTVTDNKFTMPNYNVKVVATFKKANYTNQDVTVDTNGSISIDKSTATMDEEVTITVTPNTGYELDTLNVYKKGDESTVITVTNNKFTMPTYNVEIKATFKVIVLKVTLHANNISDPFDINYGKKIDADDLKDLEIEDYIFTGWYTTEECDTLYNFDNAVTQNIDLYAGLKKITYTVSFNSNGAGDVDSQVVAIHDKAVLPNTSIKGYKLVGWFSDESLTTEYSFDSEVVADITLYAKWEKLPDAPKSSSAGVVIGIIAGVVVLFGAYIACYVLWTKGKLAIKVFDAIYKATGVVPKAIVEFAVKAWAWIKNTSGKFVNWIKNLFKKK